MSPFLTPRLTIASYADRDSVELHAALLDSAEHLAPYIGRMPPLALA